jgi:hypothetical protein
MTKRNDIETASKYFEGVDNGRIPEEIFAPGFEFYFPKFGVGRGIEQFYELAVGLGSAGLQFAHHRDHLQFYSSGSHLIVEGTTFGQDGSGASWDGGTTPGGRFCSVFEFNDDGLIGRMFIYLDPDYTGADKDRFRWHRDNPRW